MYIKNGSMQTIFYLGARGTVSAVERFTNCLNGCNCRVLILGDNLVVILAFGRSRARDFGLLCQVRRACACALAHDLKVSYHWLPSELNSADEGRRIFQSNQNQPKPNFLSFAACTKK